LSQICYGKAAPDTTTAVLRCTTVASGIVNDDSRGVVKQQLSKL
jgi:hypothetical protein